MSRSEIGRQREALLSARSNPEPLPPELTRRAETFVPASIDDDVWAVVRPLFLAVIATTSTRGADAFSKRCIALAAYLAWASTSGLELSVGALMRHEVIDDHVRSLTASNASTRRSHLRGLAADANPAGVAPAPISYPHTSVKPPYTPAEMAAIRRIALTQPTPAQRRTMCAVVGLGRGAGLDSPDLRHLEGGHCDDRGTDGIWIDVPGKRARRVPVRRDWEDIVRAGLDGVARRALVIGQSSERRNIAAKIIERAVVLGDAPSIETSRLRTTWLADLLASDVPLDVVMAVSGLQSARTITEVLQYLDGTPELGAAR